MLPKVLLERPMQMIINKLSNETVEQQIVASLYNHDKEHLATSFDHMMIVFLMASVPVVSYLISKSNYIKDNQLIVRLLFVAGYLINFITVSLPGRFDNSISKKTVTHARGKETVQNSIPWQTVFAPAGFAFAIWGAIYAGELLLSAYVGVVGKPFRLISDILPYWIAGNLFQSIWCFAFRKKFIKSLWLPSSLLLSSAISFVMMHHKLSDAISNIPLAFETIFSSCKSVNDASCISSLQDLIYNKNLREKLGLMLIRLPIALHSGWLLAATLLNVNGWAAVSNIGLKKEVLLCKFSLLLATVAASALSFKSGDPFVAFTAAWAIHAIYYQTKVTLVNLSIVDRNTLVKLESNLYKGLILVGIISPLVADYV